MEKLTVYEILKATRGKLLCGNIDRDVTNVCINSKNDCKGALFVPIHGEKVNAHDFIDDAFFNGAIATLTDEHDFAESDRIYIKVDNTLKALQRLAGYYRRKFDIPVIGITGSVGKTLTKEMVACVLSSKYNVVKTAGNLNGQVGLPLMIFNMRHDSQVAVFEMGISQEHEMETLAQIASPNHAVITNIGVTHIENLKTRENILKEKFHITDCFTEDSVLFINSDNDCLNALARDEKYHTVTFGTGHDCNLCAKNIKIDGDSTFFDIETQNLQETVEIPVLGKHNIYNALAAICVGVSFGVPMEKIKTALLNYKTLNMRQCIHNVNLSDVGGCVNDGEIKVIDDSYNANPDSMKSAIEVLSTIGKNRRKIAVLADMLELGEKSDDLHFEIGKYTIKHGIDILLTVGEKAHNIARGAKSCDDGGLAYTFGSNDEVFEKLRKMLVDGDVLLLKGSRGMHLEDVVGRFLK